MTCSVGSSIPPEIWFNICNGFPQDSGDEFIIRSVALNHLSRTSKALCTVAQPVLWSRFTNVATGTRGLSRFIQCSMAHPQLAKLLRQIELGPSRHTEHFIQSLLLNPEPIGFTPSSPESLHDSLILSHDNLHQASGYSSSDEDLRQQPLSRLSSLMFPNLERLSLEMDYDYDFPYSQEFRSSMNCPPNLREIHIQWWCEKDGFELNAIAGLLAIPSLRTAALHQVVEMDVSVNLPRNKSLEHLRFLDCYLSEDHLSRVVTAFPGLKIIEYYAAGILITADTGMEDVTATEFVDATQPLTASLKHLTLILSESYRREEKRANDSGLDEATSFAAFMYLESLKIDATSLLGTLTCFRKDSSLLIPEVKVSLKGLFPPSLTSLRIVDVYNCFLGPFQALAMEVKEQLPNLKFLHIGFCKTKHYFGDLCIMMEQKDSEGCKGSVVKEWGHHHDVLRRNPLAIDELSDTWQDTIAIFRRAGVQVGIDWTSREDFQKADGMDSFPDWVGDSDT